MINLDDERRQLARADAHIARLQELISEVEQDVAELFAQGRETAVGSQTLLTLGQSMEQFRAHRALIARTIEDLEAGRIPAA